MDSLFLDASQSFGYKVLTVVIAALTGGAVRYVNTLKSREKFHLGRLLIRLGSSVFFGVLAAEVAYVAGAENWYLVIAGVAGYAGVGLLNLFIRLWAKFWAARGGVEVSKEDLDVLDGTEPEVK